jgi:molybdopterin molybdotransferase
MYPGLYRSAPATGHTARNHAEERRETGRSRDLTPPLSAQRFIRHKGMDFTIGTELLVPGHQLHPRGLLADVASLTVWRKPRVTLLVTGDELRQSGDQRSDRDLLPDSLSQPLALSIAQWGAVIVATLRIRDDEAALRRRPASQAFSRKSR